MVVDFEPPLICAPPSDCSPSLDPLEEPSPLPVGDPRRRPPMELYVIHHSEEIVVMEAALDLALVTMMGSHRQPVSTSAIKLWLQEQFNIPCADVVVRHYQSEDFLICFTYYDDIVRVLHAHPLANMPPPLRPGVQAVAPPVVCERRELCSIGSPLRSAASRRMRDIPP
jgi:hypothetical protein